MATHPDPIGRLIEAFRQGMAIKQQREGLRLREEDAAREAERMGLEREIAELTTKLKINELYSKRSRGGAAAMPMGSNEAGVLVPGAPLDQQMPTEMILGALPRLGLNQPTHLPVASADDLMAMAIKEAGGVAEAKARGTQQGERLDIPALFQQIIQKRSGESGVEGTAPTSVAPDVLRSLITSLGQFPERTAITEDIPGIAKAGENLASPELTARTRSMEERGQATRSRESLAASMERRNSMTPKQELDETRQLANDYKKFTSGSREVQRQFGIMTETMKQIDDGTIKDLNAATQAIVTTFNKILDPASVVRESEYARSPEGQAALNRLEGRMRSIVVGGPGLTPKDLKTFVDLSKVYVDQSLKSIEGETKRIEKVADKYGLDKDLIFSGSKTGGAAGEGQPKKGDRKTFPNGNVGVFDGKGYVLVGKGK